MPGWRCEPILLISTSLMVGTAGDSGSAGKSATDLERVVDLLEHKQNNNYSVKLTFNVN